MAPWKKKALLCSIIFTVFVLVGAVLQELRLERLFADNPRRENEMSFKLGILAVELLAIGNGIIWYAYWFKNRSR